MMRRALVFLAFIGLAFGASFQDVSADETDLSGGVFITHAPAGFVYSAGMDWCAEYGVQYSIASCDEQNTNMPVLGDPNNPTLFYVVAAWDEAKVWCGSEFGISPDFDETFYFTEYGACLTNHLELPTDGWPGAGEGTAVVATDIQWEGNFQAVYYFLGYAYYTTQIQLDVDPAMDFAGTGTCPDPPPPVSFDAVCLGAMGIGDNEGVECCPGEEEPEAVCCILGECSILTEAACTDAGGTWYEELDSCDPNPCPEEWACCIGSTCTVRPEEDCLENFGTWHIGFYCPTTGIDPVYDCSAQGELTPCCLSVSECIMEYQQDCLEYWGGDVYESYESCDPNPCASPAENHSWGSIKTIYR